MDFFSLQLKTCEDDFRRETEEKSQIKTKFESKEQENERMRRENQSHTATIRHFESEVRNLFNYCMHKFLLNSAVLSGLPTDIILFINKYLYLV